MNLSSNELFHFTQFEFLKSIIGTQSFIPRFSLEFTPLGDNFRYKASLLPIAMVCFCDIPLNLSEFHQKRYGNHGIALTERWKLTKGLNPVFYIQENSFLANIFSHFMSMTDDFYEIIDDENYPYKQRMMLSTIGHDLTYLNYFIKQFDNKKSSLIIDKTARDIEKRRFYDEREWRYIPFEAENKNELFLKREDFNDSIKLANANDKLKKYKLSFEYEDISCLIVQSEKEKQELHEIAKSTFNRDVKIIIQ